MTILRRGFSMMDLFGEGRRSQAWVGPREVLGTTDTLGHLSTVMGTTLRLEPVTILFTVHKTLDVAL